MLGLPIRLFNRILMNESAKSGIYFGLTSGVITTLGLMVGLHSGTHSTQVVIGGILTIAFADSLSDALGIHISKESEINISHDEAWAATFYTFITKLFMSGSFIIPVLALPINNAIYVSILYGLLVITILSYKLARFNQDSALKTITEHLFITLLVIIVTHYIGIWVAAGFA